MSRPRVLCVDDSEAILALEQAVLGARYAVSSAADGQAALEAIARGAPDCVVLDLSMPVLDGDEVLRRLRADAATAALPVIIVTSEVRRRDDCLAAGATGFLPKPIRADALLAAVGRAIDDAVEARRRRALLTLPVTVAGVQLGLPLEQVTAVALMPETAPLPAGPPHLDRLVEVRGRPVAVLDLAGVLNARHAERLVDRRLVVLEREGVALGLVVDHVAEPLEAPPDRVTPRERLGGAAHPPLREALVAIVSREEGALPVLDVAALLAPGLLAALPAVLAAARGPAPAGQAAP